MLTLVVLGSIGLKDSSVFSVRAPEGKQETLEYTVHAGFLQNVGEAKWRYETDAESIKSEFSLQVSDWLVPITGNNLTLIRSINKYDRSADGINLDTYLYEGRVDGRVKYQLKMKRQDKDKLVYDCLNIEASDKTKCDPLPETVENPDLFGLLVWATYLEHLPKLDLEKEQPVFYQGRSGLIQFEKKSEEVLERKQEKKPVVVYEIKKINFLFGKKDLKMRVWLKQDYPHYLERVEIKDLVTMIIERKDDEKTDNLGELKW